MWEVESGGRIGRNFVPAPEGCVRACDCVCVCVCVCVCLSWFAVLSFVSCLSVEILRGTGSSDAEGGYIEVRPGGVNKGAFVSAVLSRQVCCCGMRFGTNGFPGLAWSHILSHLMHPTAAQHSTAPFFLWLGCSSSVTGCGQIGFV